MKHAFEEQYGGEEEVLLNTKSFFVGHNYVYSSTNVLLVADEERYKD